MESRNRFAHDTTRANFRRRERYTATDSAPSSLTHSKLHVTTRTRKMPRVAFCEYEPHHANEYEPHLQE